MEFSFQLIFTEILLVLTLIALIKRFYISNPIRAKKHFYKEKNQKNAIITGGSSGLGLELAKIMAERNFNVLLIARNVNKLKKAKSDILHCNEKSNSNIYFASLDVTNYTNCEQLFNTLKRDFPEFGEKIDYLFCCAGSSNPGYFLETKIQTFYSSMNVNYFGALNMTKLLLPLLLRNKDGGHIVFIGSTLSLSTFIGYSTYSPSKWALKALCDTLRNEFISTKVRFHIFYPPNMATPGFEIEEKTKPAETKKIEGKNVCFSAEFSAKSIMKGIDDGFYTVTMDWFTYSLRVLTNGSGLRSNRFLEFVLTPFFYVFHEIVRIYFDFVSKSYVPKV